MPIDPEISVTTELYGENYYLTHLSGHGDLPYERSDHWLRFFAGIADRIVTSLGPRRVLDAGCALGLLVEALRLRGVDAEGVDVSEYAISQAHESIADHVRVGSLTDPLDGTYDLVTCIEVLEHIPPPELDAALRQLTSVTDQILISSTPDDFAEPTHFNVQPPEYWAARFAELGFDHDLDFDATFLTPWAALYRRTNTPAAEVVRDYERERWRLIRERDALRGATLDQLRKEEAGSSVGSGRGAELEAMIQDLRDRLREAIDAAHGADARRATVEGRLRHVEYALWAAETREEEVADMVAEIYDVADGDVRRLDALLHSRSYRLYWRLMTPYHWLRGRKR